MVIEDNKTATGIARELNVRGIKYHDGVKWHNCAVEEILTHPKYAGCNAWGRTDRKLHGPSVKLPQNRWTMRPEAFQPVVTPETFDRAQSVLRDRTAHKTNEQFLDAAKALLEKEKRLSEKLLDESLMTPSYSAYRKRFGSMRKLYELIGYKSPQFAYFARSDLARCTRALRADLMSRIVALFPFQVALVVKKGHRDRKSVV